MAASRPTLSMVELPLDDTRWMAFVAAQPAATSFHHPAWALLLAESYALRGAVLAMVDGAGRVVGGLPALQAPSPFGRSRRWVSLPFTDSLAPLVVGTPDGGDLRVLLEAWSAERGVDRIEIRAALSGARSAPVTASSHRLVLGSDPALVESGFAASVRRNIRASEKRGIQVIRIESERELTSAYWEMHVDTRRRLGVMPQPQRFFRLLWQRMLSQELGFALLALHRGKPVAGSVFLSWNDTVIFKYGASDSASWNLRPNDALMAKAIRIGCEQGRGQFDFGRSDASDEGLRRFKRGWGADEEPLTYSVIGYGTEEGGAVKARLERITGTIVRHSPSWVARTGGSLLYRYAA